MNFNLVDYILLFIIVFMTWYGFWFGFVQMIGGILGNIIALIVAGLFYKPFSDLLLSTPLDNKPMAKIIAFFVIYVIIVKLIGIIFEYIGKILKIFSYVPGVSFINRFSGAVLGFAQGVLIAGVLVFLGLKFQIDPNWTKLIDESALLTKIEWVSRWLHVFFPNDIKNMKNIVNL